MRESKDGVNGVKVGVWLRSLYRMQSPQKALTIAQAFQISEAGTDPELAVEGRRLGLSLQARPRAAQQALFPSPAAPLNA